MQCVFDAAEGAGGELLDQALIVGAQAHGDSPENPVPVAIETSPDCSLPRCASAAIRSEPSAGRQPGLLRAARVPPCRPARFPGLGRRPDQDRRPSSPHPGSEPGEGGPAHPHPDSGRPRRQRVHPVLRHRGRAPADCLPRRVHTPPPGRRGRLGPMTARPCSSSWTSPARRRTTSSRPPKPLSVSTPTARSWSASPASVPSSQPASSPRSVTTGPASPTSEHPSPA